jgi:bifunctional DNA-binding transcriptional regulator/antitoxin component of YhaV-PrlF toxin-antitoxin module
MPLFRRRPTLPADVRARLDLRTGDRVVAWAQLVDGWAVASVRGLSVARDGEDVRRRPWSDVDRAALDPETATLTVEWVEGAPDRLRLTDDRPAAFPAALRERVQSSVVHSETVTTPDGLRIRVALRRGEDGALLTQVLGDERVDLADPAVAALVDAAEARVREAAGLPR